MAVYKDKNGTWYVSARYTNWKGEADRKVKRGFQTKCEAAEWEKNFFLENAGNLDMTFEAFYQLYKQNTKDRIKLNTWKMKESVIEGKILPYFRSRRMNEIKPRDVVLAAYDAESRKRKVENLLAMYQNLVQMMREIPLDTPKQKELIHEALSLFEHLPKLNEQDAQAEINAYAARLSEQNLEAFSNNDDKQFDVIYRICNAIQMVCIEKNSGLAEVARKVYLSPNYVSTIFKQYTGETVTQRMSRVRLDVAKSLLQNPAMKIYEVSEKVGYTNPYYFSVWFKKMTGISPSNYRRSHCIDRPDDK